MIIFNFGIVKCNIILYNKKRVMLYDVKRCKPQHNGLF